MLASATYIGSLLPEQTQVTAQGGGAQLEHGCEEDSGRTDLVSRLKTGFYSTVYAKQ